MKIASFSLLLVSLLLPGLAFGLEGVVMEKHRVLNQKQESVITIAAFTANGDMPRLKTALNEGLDAGLTVNEIKEILVQMYAYAGFPRSLNGLGAFMAVLDERQAKGIKDVMGKDASPIPEELNRDEYGAKVRAKLAGQEVIPPPGGYQLFTPIIDKFLKEHLFADIFARDVLTFQERELATIAALTSMPGLEGPLSFHLGAAMNTGLTEEQMKAFIVVIKSKVGSKEADSVNKLVTELLAKRTVK